MFFLRITAVGSLRIRGLQNSSARTCESNKGVFSNMELCVAQKNVIEEKLLEIKRSIRRGIYLLQVHSGHFSL